MLRSGTEIEIKLRFESADRARQALEAIGATVASPRVFEDNVLVDRDDAPLFAAGRMLRVRHVGERGCLTFKAPGNGSRRYKIRREIESRVDDPGAIERILAELGFKPRYRYQKYRTTYDLDGVLACVDETPIGCYVELEGAPASIDAAAARLGCAPRDYIRVSYRDLQLEAVARGEAPPGDMVFDEEPPGP